MADLAESTGTGCIRCRTTMAWRRACRAGRWAERRKAAARLIQPLQKIHAVRLGRTVRRSRCGNIKQSAEACHVLMPNAASSARRRRHAVRGYRERKRAPRCRALRRLRNEAARRAATPGRPWRRPGRAGRRRRPPPCAGCATCWTKSSRRRPLRAGPEAAAEMTRGGRATAASRRRRSASRHSAGARPHRDARGCVSCAGRNRRLLSPHRAAFAACLYAGRGGTARPPDLAGTAGGESCPTQDSRAMISQQS